MKLTLLSGVLLAGIIATFAVMTATSEAVSVTQGTRDHLQTAMRGEAFAAAKYQLFADHARKNGNSELADLFERTAKVERFEHLAEEAELAQLVGSDSANLQDAIAGESYEIDAMYRDFAEQANTAGDGAAGSLFEEIRRDEVTHRDAFRTALQRLQSTDGR